MLFVLPIRRPYTTLATFFSPFGFQGRLSCRPAEPGSTNAEDIQDSDFTLTADTTRSQPTEDSHGRQTNPQVYKRSLPHTEEALDGQEKLTSTDEADGCRRSPRQFCLWKMWAARLLCRDVMSRTLPVWSPKSA